MNIVMDRINICHGKWFRLVCFLRKNVSPSFHLHLKMEIVSLLTTKPAHLGSEFVQCAGNKNSRVIKRAQWDNP